MQLWVSTCPHVSYALPPSSLRDLCVPAFTQGAPHVWDTHLMPSCLFKDIIPSALPSLLSFLFSTGSNPNANILWFFFFPVLKTFQLQSSLQQLSHVWWYFLRIFLLYTLSGWGFVIPGFLLYSQCLEKPCPARVACKYLLNRYSVSISPSVLLDSILI